MLGSIIGDIVGSIYEFDNIKTKEFDFFSPKGSYTDDSILTLATADWILNGGDVAHYYSQYAIDYPHPMGGYGSGFFDWVQCTRYDKKFIPYYSCGNGSAMRVGPVGWAFKTKKEVLAKAKESAECTHDHPEGIKGAQSVAACIYMARNGKSKQEIKEYVEANFGYDLSRTCDEIRPDYRFEVSCQKSVPESIIAFLESNDFESAVRLAVSMGGDADTMGAITGSIAEAFYGGMSAYIKQETLNRMPEEFVDVMSRFNLKFR